MFLTFPISKELYIKKKRRRPCLFKLYHVVLIGKKLATWVAAGQKIDFFVQKADFSVIVNISVKIL